MNLEETLGFDHNGAPDPEAEHRAVEYVNLKLAARGLSVVGDPAKYPFLELGKSLFANFQEKSRSLIVEMRELSTRNEQEISQAVEDGKRRMVQLAKSGKLLTNE